MNRIVIFGLNGAGKSTLARAIARTIELPVLHLDTVSFLENWERRDPELVQGDISKFAQGERWVVEGNGVQFIRYCIDHADTLIFLDPPLLICLWRHLSRTVGNMGQVLPDVAPGCPERISLPTFAAMIRYHGRRRLRHAGLLRRVADTKTTVHLRTPSAVEVFMGSLRPRGQ